MNDLILVIDMQNVYGRGGAWECSNMERTKDNIHKLLSSGLDVASLSSIRLLLRMVPGMNTAESIRI